MAHEDCIFCMVLRGEIPSERVYEDDHAIGVMDINPWTRGHAVVFPRKHAADLFEIEDEELEHVAVAAKRLATKMRDTLGCDGVNLLQSNGRAAWQTRSARTKRDASTTASWGARWSSTLTGSGTAA